MYCKKCGIEINDGEILCEKCKGESSKSGIINIFSMLLSILEIALPFIAWIKVPVAEGLYSLFGMQNETPSFSLFGFIFAGEQ